MPRQRRQRARFYVPTDTFGTSEGARIGVAWLAEHGREWGGEALVVVPSADHVHRDSHVDGATRHHRWVTAISYRTAQAEGWHGGPTLLLYPPDGRVLGWFAKSRLARALCVVQGPLFDTTAWARAFGPVDLSTGAPYPAGPRLDPTVQKAFDSLGASIAGTGLTRRADVAWAVRTLGTLSARGYAVDPVDAETWALTQGWSPVGAHRLAGFASRIAAGEHIALTSDDGPSSEDVNRWLAATVSPDGDARLGLP